MKPDVPEEEVDVTPLAAVDTAAYADEIDSVALTPQDKARFGGFLLATRVTFDAGAAIVSRTFSTVVFSDTSRPVVVGGRQVGYFGLPIRSGNQLTLTINGVPMFSVPHLVRGAEAGTEYTRELSGLLPADSVYAWHAAAAVFGVIDISLKAPPAISVSSPAGGTVIPRNQDLIMRWGGAGQMTIYVSVRNLLTNRSRPVVRLTPVVNRGHARLPVKVLRALLPDRYYVFTFVLANRREDVLVARYKANVLAQAATVYNSYVELR
jgi:hypothetical protein